MTRGLSRFWTMLGVGLGFILFRGDKSKVVVFLRPAEILSIPERHAVLF
jgi:hypothetical protein